jgi:hypothetical protein
MKLCKWFAVCPLKQVYEQGKLDERWVEEYCWRDNPECVRRKMEEKGVYHPDNMLPDGTIDGGLR